MISRRYGPDDKEAVMAVLSACYDGWHGDSSEAFWAWKFDRNPHGPARIWVGDDGGEIAGCYILNPVTLQVGEATIHGAQAVDAAVNPDYRGRGVFTDLARVALTGATDEGIGLVFAFPSAGALGGQIRVGFKPQFVVPMASRPLLWPPRPRRFDGLTLNEVNKFDLRFDAFAKCGRNREVSVRRDAAYLQWRYYAHPTKTYETITCERDGEIYGYCVLNVDATRKVAHGLVVDFQVLPESGSTARFLAYHALRRLHSLGARVAVSWERHTGPEQEALRSFGFSRRYASIRRGFKRPQYIEQLIAFEGEDGGVPELRPGRSIADPLRWSLVPGDADYT
jgi:GNAT superfamily N-acetyltransferase